MRLKRAVSRQGKSFPHRSTNDVHDFLGHTAPGGKHWGYWGLPLPDDDIEFSSNLPSFELNSMPDTVPWVPSVQELTAWGLGDRRTWHPWGAQSGEAMGGPVRRVLGLSVLEGDPEGAADATGPLAAQGWAVLRVMRAWSLLSRPQIPHRRPGGVCLRGAHQAGVDGVPDDPALGLQQDGLHVRWVQREAALQPGQACRPQAPRQVGAVRRVASTPAPLLGA